MFVGSMVDVEVFIHVIPSTSWDKVSLGILKVDDGLDMPPSVDERFEIDELALFISFVGISFALSVYLVPSISGDMVSLGIIKVDGGLDRPS